MNTIQIENPTQIISYSLAWNELKKHIVKVMARFPKEYSLIKEEETMMVILNIPISQANMAIGKDQLIYVQKETEVETKTTLKFLITNENNQISSYTELERDKKSLNVLTILLKKSIDGTLEKNAHQKPTATANPVQGFIQILLLLAALAAIYYGLQALAG